MDKTGQYDQDGCIIISIDWGTTFASASYVYLENRQRSTDIRLGEFPTNNLKCIHFPDSHGNNKQVKTQMAWLSEKRAWLWGHEVDQAIHNGEIEPAKRIEFLKLALDTRDDKTQRQRDVIQEQLKYLPDECGVVSVLQLISTFLTKMFVHILHKIHSARGDDIIAHATLECILSVPALWELEEREMMIKAARTAGIPDTRLVSEPEAAAIFWIHERLVEQPALRNNQNEETQVRSSGELSLRRSEH